jgi:hypothetical protein
MSPAKTIVTGCAGAAVVLVIDDEVVVDSAPSATGESCEPPEQQATSSAGTIQPTLAHRTDQRYRFVVPGLPDYNLGKLLSGQCCLESAWTEPIRRPTG